MIILKREYLVLFIVGAFCIIGLLLQFTHKVWGWP